MSINKLVHETQSGCTHEWRNLAVQDSYILLVCAHCDCEKSAIPDYENDMNACMELWKEVGLYDLVNDENPDHPGPIQGPKLWIASLPPEDDDPVREYKDGGYHETPQLAIIHAFLKSKGVDLEKETQ